MEYCGSGAFKRILDIGPGSGNDTIPLILTHNVQVIGVDIQKKQLNELNSRVTNTLKNDFSTLIKAQHFASAKRNFACEDSVPPKYNKAFQGANLCRVLHFFDRKQTQIIVKNVASMLKDNAMLSLTVFTYKPGSREESWSKEQEERGLSDPGLIYYDIVTEINDRNKLLAMLEHPLIREFKFVPRHVAGLSSPGYKKEFVNNTNGKTEHVIRQGRYYHTLQSVDGFLNPYFTIQDSTIEQYNDEDVFLSVIARKKPNS